MLPIVDVGVGREQKATIRAGGRTCVLHFRHDGHRLLSVEATHDLTGIARDCCDALRWK